MPDNVKNIFNKFTGASCLYMILQIRCVSGLYSHWLQGYHDSLRVVSMWFFKFTSFMFCIHIVYRGIRILHELFVNASSISLGVCFFIHIGYRVSWFFVSCLYVILQHHSFCVFLFALVTGVSWFFANCLNVILQIQFVCILIGYRGITILCELPINESSISLYVLFCIHIG